MMELSTTDPRSALSGAGALALFAHGDRLARVPRGLSGPAARRLLGQARAEGFKGGPGETAVVSRPRGGGSKAFLLAGLGPRSGFSPERLRRAAGAAATLAWPRWTELDLLPPAPLQAAAEGALLGSYRFLDYRKAEGGRLAKARLVVSSPAERAAAERALARARLACEAVGLVRDLVNRGPSDKSPKSLADLALTFRSPEVEVEVIDRLKAQELGMGSFLGVARGSAAEPFLAHLRYRPRGRPSRRVALVGKGITFDSGGLSLKPPQAMETMKMDMAGAASVLGVFRVLPRLGARAEVHGVCALTYNMPGPDALKPGDVVRAMNGKTIEVLNTDAEGRLILADALAYAAGLKPDALIDLATLTGAVVTALGSRVTGMMGSHRGLLKDLAAAAARAGEAVCELPLVEDYREHIKSQVADIQNIGKVRGEAGSIIGGLFLEEFTGGRPWVHLDIAGTAWADSPYAYGPAGGTGAMVRTLLEYLSGL